MNNTNQNGKGDRARNCHNKQFRANYEDINWSRSTNPSEFERLKPKKTYDKINSIIAYIRLRKVELEHVHTYSCDLIELEKQMLELKELFLNGK